MSFFHDKAQPAPDKGELPRELFLKEYVSPLTGESFKALTAKTNAYITRSRDTDFRPVYGGFNPLYYSVIVDPLGFAAEASVYDRSAAFLFRDMDALTAHLRSLPAARMLRGLRSISQACASFDWALDCAPFLKLLRSDVASLALKASWVYRDWLEEGQEDAADQITKLRKLALDMYLDAYENEDTSKLKMGSPGVAYLIAELHRERGEFEDSQRWFSRVVTDKDVGGEVKRLARDQMEVCRTQRKAAQASAGKPTVVPERRRERAIFQLFDDQIRWLEKTAETTEVTDSEIVRGILQGLKDGGVKLEQFSGEEHLAGWLAARLKGG